MINNIKFKKKNHISYERVKKKTTLPRSTRHVIILHILILNVIDTYYYTFIHHMTCLLLALSKICFESQTRGTWLNGFIFVIYYYYYYRLLAKVANTNTTPTLLLLLDSPLNHSKNNWPPFNFVHVGWCSNFKHAFF